MIRRSAVDRIVAASSYFAEYLESEAKAGESDIDGVLANYVAFRREIAEQVQTICTNLLVGSESLLHSHRVRVERRMRELFGAQAPSTLLRLRGYRGIHSVILEYLAQHVGDGVPASVIRMLSGDQVHTERRIRELRDLGFVVTWQRAGGDTQYVLRSKEPDVEAAAYLQLERNIKASRTLPGPMRRNLLTICAVNVEKSQPKQKRL
jgi:hypothetical protein